MTEATIVGTLTDPPAPGQRRLPSIPDAVAWLNVRADLVGDLSPHWLSSQFSGKLLYTLRSEAEGGAFKGSTEERRARLIENAKNYDCIELEGERDLHSDVLSAIPPHKRLISWQGPATSCAVLQRRLHDYSEVPARMYKLVPMGVQA